MQLGRSGPPSPMAPHLLLHWTTPAALCFAQPALLSHWPMGHSLLAPSPPQLAIITHQDREPMETCLTCTLTHYLTTAQAQVMRGRASVLVPLRFVWINCCSTKMNCSNCFKVIYLKLMLEVMESTHTEDYFVPKLQITDMTYN